LGPSDGTGARGDGARQDRIAAAFARARAEGRPALIPFLPVCWPEPHATAPIVRAAVEGGADLIELGFPFSDPLADGVTNQRAYEEALANGATFDRLFAITRELRSEGVRVPFLIMGYFNPLLAYGTSRFVRDAVEAGVDGLIVVDLPPEEAAELAGPARAAELHLVYLLAPTSTEERIAKVAAAASGFIYCVSVAGVTGPRAELPPSLPEFIGRVRAQTDLPLAVGFGISTARHVEAVGRIADAAIVGSAFVQAVRDAPPATRPTRVREFVRGIAGREPAASDDG
jgi:tryptophan synthase alpha subunit